MQCGLALLWHSRHHGTLLWQLDCSHQGQAFECCDVIISGKNCDQEVLGACIFTLTQTLYILGWEHCNCRDWPSLKVFDLGDEDCLKFWLGIGLELDSCDMARGNYTREWPRTGEFMANLNETLSGMGHTLHLRTRPSISRLKLKQSIIWSLKQNVDCWGLFDSCLRRSWPMYDHLGVRHQGAEARWLRLRASEGPAPVTESRLAVGTQSSSEAQVTQRADNLKTDRSH